jgi:type I restriction enzyme R subunit
MAVVVSQSQNEIEDILDKGLPNRFTQDMFHQKCDLIYQHIYDSYFGEGRSVYAVAS